MRTLSKSNRVWVVSILVVVAVVASVVYYPRLKDSINSRAFFASLESWITYQSDRSDFTAALPSEPQRDSSSSTDQATGITTNSEIYTSGVKGDAYVINVFRYVGPVEFSQPKVNLQNLLTAWVAKSKNSILQSSAFSTFESHDALEFHIVNGTENVKGLIIARDKTIYEVFANYEDQQPAASSYEKFIGGFKFR